MYHSWRRIKDIVVRHIVTVVGISIIFMIMLIGIYLFSVILPMLKPVQMSMHNDYSLPGYQHEKTYLYATEEQFEVGLRLTESGKIFFFDIKNGKVISEFLLPIPKDATITAYMAGDPAQRSVAVGLSNGTVLFFKHHYLISYPDDVRTITPQIQYPFGPAPIPVSIEAKALNQLAIQMDDERARIVGKDTTDTVYLLSVEKKSNLWDEHNITSVVERVRLPGLYSDIEGFAMSASQRELYIIGQTVVSYFDITDNARPRLIQRVLASSYHDPISSFAMLSGGGSLLLGHKSGMISQLFPVRDMNNNYTLEQIRSFDSQSSEIIAIIPEYFRKVFLGIAADGSLGLYHSTAGRILKFIETATSRYKPISTIAPRGNGLLLENSEGRLQIWHIYNEHPEVSWQSIWGKVWYEARSGPEYIWQSSSASNDFEPKFSLTPLAFGTFKSAFYAMLFAIPLAIMGAIYIAYFAAEPVRRSVKPTIEIMEALPTVILGFLAGLWLAPLIENHMVDVFLLCFLLPLVTLIFGFFWNCLPIQISQHIPKGWEALLLIPILLIVCCGVILIGSTVEEYFFSGNMPLWITEEIGIGFDQRNSLVVGIAMGFAVIPTIFSISEDAIYSAPKHLTIGSLALGATRWQSLLWVILPTASPGIFSAVMIGLGRAVGETMIVVMATGNTPIMDMNIFEGFRAMSANIAVEMPESEVGSTHYRLLFLAAFVLFLVTFLLNTLAELVRQRLRMKYSRL